MTSIEDLVLKHRDIYMNFKELSDRCFIDINQLDANEKRLYYMAPDSPFLDEPEKLKNYRQRLIKQVSTIPQPEPILLMAHELQKQAVMDLEDRSQPEKAKEDLTNYYKRRENQLQHQKYRILHRWAHYALSSEKCDRMVQEMNFYLSKLQTEKELCIKRSQRLEGPDDFVKAKVYKRPSTKAKVGGSLYVENLHPPPISCIRQDDIEVWLRRQTYLNKCYRMFYKYLDKLKWIALLERFEILEESMIYAKDQRVESFLVQNEHIEEIESYAKKDIKRKKATELNLEEVKNTYHCVTYKEKVLNKADEIRHSMTYDHELLPTFISNTIELIIDILSRSAEYDIHGNIDLDQGYSFLYQIAIFFPLQFQKQVVKTTFKPYDGDPSQDDYSANLEKVVDFQGKGSEKVPIQNMIRGVKDEEKEEDDEDAEKNKAPMFTPLDSISDLKANAEYKNIVSPQLKVSDWLYLEEQLIAKVKPYMKKQIAFLNTDNPIDLLLKFSYDLTCGVQDVSVMNALVEDISKKHAYCVDGSLKQLLKDKEFEEIKYKDSTDIYSQFMEALENKLKMNFPDLFNVVKQSKRMVKKSNNFFFNLPEHLIHAYYMLRHLKIRDFKIKIQYALNYYRSVQRRLTFDLHELKTRDTILGDIEFKPPSDASRVSIKNMTNDTSAGSAGNSKKQQLAKAKAALTENDDGNRKGTPHAGSSPDYSKVENIYKKAKEEAAHKNSEDMETDENPIDKNKYRYKEKFKNKFISTCPIMSRYHTSFGYTMHRVSMAEEEEYEFENREHMDMTAKKFMGRQDFVEFGDNEEILVKDDFGVYIMYDCVDTDLEMLRNELLLAGSFYIKRQEPLMNSEDLENMSPLIDRISTLEILMKYESKFQYKKAQIVRLYMETYDHIYDPLEQQRFIQMIVDFMAERPRLNLDSCSFEDSYKLELEILDKRKELLENVIRFQIKSEKTINENICDYLEKGHKILNDSINGKWKYLRHEQINGELEKRGIERVVDEDKSQLKVSTKDIPEPNDDNNAEGSKKVPGSPTREKSPSKREMEDLYKQKRRGLIGLEEEPEDRFSDALGLPKISQEDIYKRYKENDQEALDMMNEYATFVKNEDSNPKRFNNKEYVLDTFMSGEKIGVLDFYESLGCIHWLQNMIDQCMRELIDVHKPINNYRLAALEIKLLDKAISKFSDVKDQEDNNVFEYEGKPYIEDECLIGNPDIIRFLVKELTASLNSGDPRYINPFIVGKLDLETIKFFKFPSSRGMKMKQRFNRKYNEEDGQGDPYTDTKFLTTEEIANMIKEQAERDRKQTEKEISADYFKIETQNSRRVNSPKGLFLYCNILELIRLRSVLIRLITETKELELIYHKQRKRVGRESYKLRFSDQVSFENNNLNPDKINFIDEGPMTGVETYLAITEFDKSMISCINFRDPLCFQTLICSCGLEELRAVIHYQIMHMQVLIIGVRLNQEMLDPSLKALSELNLLKQGCCLSNSSFDVDSILTKFGEGFNQYAFEKERTKYSNYINSVVGQNFYQVCERKSGYRSTLAKKCSNYTSQISNTYAKLECELRMVRVFRIKLLHGYCFNILREAYCDSLKIQLIDVCGRLKNDFKILPKKYSICSKIDSDENSVEKFELIKDIKEENCIKDFFAIPTIDEIIKLESYSFDEMEDMLRQFNGLNFKVTKTFQKELDSVVHPTDEYSSSDAHHQPHFTQSEDLEHSIREMFIEYKPTFYRPDLHEYNASDKDASIYKMCIFHDFDGCISYEIFLFKILCYYSMLYRIFKLEYFISKSPSNLYDVLELEKNVLNGVDYWKVVENEELEIKDEESKFEIYSDSEDARSHENHISKSIIKKIVNERRRRSKLQTDLEILFDSMNSFKSSISALQEKNLTSIIEFVTLYHENRFQNVIYCIDKCLERLYSNETTQENETSVIKQVISINNLKKKLSNRERRFIPWFNYRYYCNYSEYYIKTKTVINENAMIPKQIGILEDIYIPIRFSK